MTAPQVSSVIPPSAPGTANTVYTAIKVGQPGKTLTFNKGIRIRFPNQANKLVGYSITGTDFTEITDICSADNQTAGNLIATDCKMNVGSDLVIWTKHFTDYITFDGHPATDNLTLVGLDIDSSISLACGSGVTMGNIINGTGPSNLSTNSVSCTVRTNNSNGYKLDWQASSTDMSTSTGPGTVPITSYVPTTPNTPETWSISDTVSAWGAKLQSDSSTYDSSKWGTADTYAGGKWLNISTSPYTIIQRTNETDNTGDTESLLFGAEVGGNKIQPSGTYSVNITITATTL